VPFPPISGASGSWQMTANPWTLLPDALHASGGETSSPSPVYRAGIGPPAVNAVLVNRIVDGAKPMAMPLRTSELP
jgi:hypothetical protein